MQLLVTGGSGFVGGRLLPAAVRAGYGVTVLGRTRPAALPAGAGWLAADLARPDELAALVAAARPEAVLHAAALVHGTPAELEAVNVEGTRTLLTAVRGWSSTPRVIYVSSFAVEDTPPTAYSESKRAAEAVVAAAGLPWVVLRPTLIYGPGDTSNGPRLIAKLRAGSHWLPCGGRTRIQPVHVDDVVAACLAALVRPEAVGHTYRLGGAEPLSVRAWRESVRDATGGHARVRSIPRPLFALAAHALALAGRPGSRAVLAFHRADHAVDSSEARADLGFAPRSTAEGLRHTYAPAPR